MRKNRKRVFCSIMMKRTVYLLIIILLAAGVVSCREGAPEEIKGDLFALDTYITFTLYGGSRAQNGLEAAIQRLQEIEERMSATIPGSDIWRVNESAGKEPVVVHQDTFHVIQTALKYGDLTHGAFDITMLPVGRLWNITAEDPRVPSEDEIREALKLVDYRKVRLNEAERSVFLEEEGMMMDLGGIAKGYVGDEAARILRAHGVTNALINLGGDILTIGSKPDGTDWRIGIQNPRLEGQGPRHISIAEVSDETIVTSGDYERYMVQVFEETGIRYHHIFDPATGYPARKGLMSTTVVGRSAIDTDALSTSLFILGLEEGMRLIEGLEDTEAILVTEDREVYLTEGLKGRTTPAHPQYTFQN